MLIDEWDTICRESSDYPQLMTQYISLLRNLFKSDNTNRVFAGVYMTGILPIKSYGTQSALNNFRMYSMTNPKPLERFFGFTEDEVVAEFSGSILLVGISYSRKSKKHTCVIERIEKTQGAAV